MKHVLYARYADLVFVTTDDSVPFENTTG